MAATKKYMTVGMLEDELIRLRGGLNEVIKVLKAMDRRELVTTIEDPRIGGLGKPYACPAVGWECDEKIWRLQPARNRRMTNSIRRAILAFMYGVTPCVGRLARYIDHHTKV
jgi:hypothetical protein